MYKSMLIASLMFSGVAVGANIGLRVAIGTNMGLRANVGLGSVSEEKVEEFECPEFKCSECGKMIQKVFREGHRQFHLNKAKKASSKGGADLTIEEAQEDNEKAFEDLWNENDLYVDSHSSGIFNGIKTLFYGSCSSATLTTEELILHEESKTLKRLREAGEI